MKEELRGVCPARFTSLFAKGGDMTDDKTKANTVGQEVTKLDDAQLEDVAGGAWPDDFTIPWLKARAIRRSSPDG
jgi:hypothetical protein